MIDAEATAAARAGDRLRAWAQRARTGDVVEPLGALEAILARAAALVRPDERERWVKHYPEPTDPSARARWEQGLASALVAAEARGRVERWMLANLVRGAFALPQAAHYVVGGTRASSDGREVVALAYRRGALLTIGAKRANKTRWTRYDKWTHPGHAWPEVGAWSILGKNGRGDARLAGPLRARLDAWADAQADDRLTLDAVTARAVAVAVFLEPFERPGKGLEGDILHGSAKHS